MVIDHQCRRCGNITFEEKDDGTVKVWSPYIEDDLCERCASLRGKIHLWLTEQIYKLWGLSDRYPIYNLKLRETWGYCKNSHRYRKIFKDKPLRRSMYVEDE